MNTRFAVPEFPSAPVGSSIDALGIIVLDDEGDDEIPSDNGEKVLVCHKPDKKGGHTISIASPAVPAHLAHGDKLGPCP